MAGDWIKMRTDLATDPAVVDMAIRLGFGEDMIVGKLHRFWSWVTTHFAEANLKPDCSATRAWIDHYVGVPGFVEAMIEVGWIAISGGDLSIPSYHRHMSEGAKRRSLRSEQQKLRRRSQNEAKMKPNSASKRLPEKRREEKIDTSKEVSITQCETIYELYPRRVGKADAIKAIRSALGKASFEDLKEAVESYAQARKGEDQQYTPHPATWFNQERWTDDRSTWRSSQKPSDPTRVHADGESPYTANLV
jgi:hypothetical protein